MQHTTATLEPISRLRLPVLGWLAVTLAIAMTGVISYAPFLVPLCTGGTIAAGVVLYRRGGALRAVADRLDLRWAILVHAIRAPIGAYILIEASRGVIPSLFADRAGPGDVAAGVLALAAAAAIPAATRARRGVVIAWCALGLLDLAVAFSTAQYLFFIVGDPRMQLIAQLPWSLLPTLIVPVMILTHLLVLTRTLRRP